MMMRVNPVGWFEIYVDDMERAKAFYERMLEVKLQPLGGPELDMWSFPMDENGPGISGALTTFEGFGPGAGGTVVYFACEDCALEAARAADAGGRVIKPKFSIGEFGFAAIVHDTEGNVIGLHSMR
jgi:uncharacterized protein